MKLGSCPLHTCQQTIIYHLNLTCSPLLHFPDEARIRVPGGPPGPLQPRDPGRPGVQAQGVCGADQPEREQHVGHPQVAGGDLHEAGRGQVPARQGPQQAAHQVRRRGFPLLW
jgi:hypothetical protein